MRIKRTTKYNDIIDLPYVKSSKRPHMSIEDRAAQFAPFAALTGHKEAVDETARITEKRRILDEHIKVILDRKLSEIIADIHEKPLVDITYFVEDDFKEGGQYVTIKGRIKKIDEIERTIIFEDDTQVLIENVWEISKK